MELAEVQAGPDTMVIKKNKVDYVLEMTRTQDLTFLAHETTQQTLFQQI